MYNPFLNPNANVSKDWLQQKKNAAQLQQINQALDPNNPAVKAVQTNAGIAPVPTGAPEATKVKITINTEGQTATKEIVIGCGDIYKAKGGSGWTSNPAGTVYSGSPSNNRYDLLLDDLKNSTYLFSMVKIETFATVSDTTGGTAAKAQLFDAWTRVSGDVQNIYGTEEIDIESGRDPYQQDNNLTTYSFQNQEGRLDRLSCYVLNVRPNVEMKMTLYVSGRGNGRI